VNVDWMMVFGIGLLRSRLEVVVHSFITTNFFGGVHFIWWSTFLHKRAQLILLKTVKYLCEKHQIFVDAFVEENIENSRIHFIFYFHWWTFDFQFH